MNITRNVTVEGEVEIRISVEEIAAALACEPQDSVELRAALNNMYQFLRAVPDALIERLTEQDRLSTYEGLMPLVQRFRVEPGGEGTG